MNNIDIDLLIFGGGIAGLWSLLRARAAGYSVLLLESGALGGIQSIASQGIIHGGTKYALGGQLSEAARAIGEMPGRWQQCLAGRGEINLSRVRLLSAHQFLWSSGNLSSSTAAFLAGKLMRSRVTALTAAEFPAPFDTPAFKGRLYRLNEPVMDTHSLMHELARQALPQCARYELSSLRVNGATIELPRLRISPRSILFSAGRNNPQLLRLWHQPQPTMQTRPLHMVMARGPLPSIHAHCLGVSANPRLTLTSYPLANGEQLWYMGGDLAETGVQRSSSQQIQAAAAELEQRLPWLDRSALRWSSLRIDRAEVATRGGKRPDDCYLHQQDNRFTAWPTKLALAPRLADLLLERLPPPGGLPLIDDWPLEKPDLATLPWEQATWK